MREFLISYYFKSQISDIYSQKYTKIKIISGDNLPLEKTLHLYNLIILTKSSFHRNHNRYYCQRFLEKYSYK